MGENDIPDKSLVTGLRSGDREAFRLTYERYKGDVSALLAAMLGRQDAVWDLLHDVFISLAGRAAGLAPESNLKGYLLTAAANHARDFLARHRACSAGLDLADRITAPAQDEPCSIAGRKEDADRLWQAVLELPEDQRLVVALHIYGGLTLKEIAAREGISENTAQSRYRYALDRLRRHLAGAQR